MNEASTLVRTFLKSISGAWTGKEKMADASGGMEELVAEAEFENSPALGGSGITSAYRQRMDGLTTMSCQTTYRFEPNGKVLMTWTPSSGDACIFQGTLEENVIKVSRKDADGLQHTIRSDYREPDVAHITATIAGEMMPETVVFSGKYKRRQRV